MGIAIAHFEDGSVIETDNLHVAFDTGSQHSRTRAVRLMGEFDMDRQVFCNSTNIIVDAKTALFIGYWESPTDHAMFQFRNSDNDTRVVWNGGSFIPDRKPDGIQDRQMDAIRVQAKWKNARVIINNVSVVNAAGGFCFETLDANREEADTGNIATGRIHATVVGCIFSEFYGDRRPNGTRESGHSQGVYASGRVDLEMLDSTTRDIGWRRNDPMYQADVFCHGLYFIGGTAVVTGCSFSSCAHSGLQFRTGVCVGAFNNYADNAIHLEHGHHQNPNDAVCYSYGEDFSEPRALYEVAGQRRECLIHINRSNVSVVSGCAYNPMEPEKAPTGEWGAIAVASVGRRLIISDMKIGDRLIGMHISRPLPPESIVRRLDLSACSKPLWIQWDETGPRQAIGGTWIDCNVPGYTTEPVGPAREGAAQ